MTDGEDIVKYYAQRASEYEEIYYRNDPARLMAQKYLVKIIQKELKRREVLEIACGTGYWTQFLSQTAQTITATDINLQTIKIAKTKNYACQIVFQIADAYNLPFSDQTFTGGLAAFWFSHIPKHKIEVFLREFLRVLKPGAKVLFIDNALRDALTLIKKQGDTNTYRRRKLKDNSQYLIIKNYFTREELVTIFKKHLPTFSTTNVYQDDYFWYVLYTVQK